MAVKRIKATIHQYFLGKKGLKKMLQMSILSIDNLIPSMGI